MAGNTTSTTFKYIPNIPAIEIAATEGGTLGVLFATPRVAEAARSIAPVLTGAFRDSIVHEIHGLKGIVYSDIRYAKYLEFGTSDTPTFAVFRRASEMVHV